MQNYILAPLDRTPSVSRELSLLFLVHFDVHKLTLIASLTENAILAEIGLSGAILLHRPENLASHLICNVPIMQVLNRLK